MTQQDALYRAVCEHPNEDTPRLIFADLLEEEGDAPRAAFIRTQVELARVPEHDSLWANCRRRDPDAIRGWGMAHTLPKLPSGFSWRAFQFRRGFPWLASVLELDTFLESGTKLFQTAPIQALELDHATGIGKRFAEFAESPHLERIHRLEFAHTRFDDLPMKSLGYSSHAANLDELAFEGHAIESDGLRVLAESPLFGRLRRFELNRAALSPALLIDALAAASGNGNLASLSLADCKLPAPDVAHLLSLPVLDSVTTLDLSDNPLRAEGVEAIAESLPRSHALRGNVLVDALRRGRQMAQNVEEGIPTQVEGTRFREGRHSRSYEMLKLKSTYPGVQGVKALRAALGSVRWLDLSTNRLGPTAITFLADSEHARSLRVLDVSNNPIGASGACALAESPHLEGLMELVLRGCKIGEAGTAALERRFGSRVRL